MKEHFGCKKSQFIFGGLWKSLLPYEVEIYYGYNKVDSGGWNVLRDVEMLDNFKRCIVLEI